MKNEFDVIGAAIDSQIEIAKDYEKLERKYNQLLRDYRRLQRKVAHGCTDASCEQCDSEASDE